MARTGDLKTGAVATRPRCGRLARVAVLAILAVQAPVEAGAAGAEQGPVPVLQVGDAMPPLALQDQHARPVTVDDGTKILIFTRDMDAGGIVKEALAADGAELLAAGDAVYVSDVSGMPTLVRSMFAMPALRRRSYSVALDEAGDATASVPTEAGKATILRFDSGRIASISFSSSSGQLRSMLGE